MVIVKVYIVLYLTLKFAACIEPVDSLNILGIFPFRSQSHFIVFETYLKELALRGHNVTVISYFPQNESVKNYHDIALAEKVIIYEDNVPVDWNIMQTILFIAGTSDICKILLGNRNVQELWKTKAKFDVVVTELFISDCPLGLTHVLKAPVVGLTSHALMPWHHSRFGVLSHPAYVSHTYLNGGTRPTISQKIMRVIFDIISKVVYTYFNQWADQNTLAKYFDDIPPLEDLARNIKFMLLYTNFIYSGTKIFPQNIIEVGGYHVPKSKKLPNNLLKFVEEAKYGVVYISFGTVINSSSLANDKFEAIVGAIQKLPQRFIWKHHNKTLFLDGNKLYTAKWLPQIDILGHPNILAFFSHAGMASTTEAFYFGVPVVAMPILGDQPYNAAAIEESCMGVKLELCDLTTDSLVTALRKVMEPEFRANVKLVSKAWHDRPMSPMDTAIYWTEYAARYSNFTFRTAAADVPWYQYIHLDIVVVCLMLLLLLASCFKVTLWVYSIISIKARNNNQKIKYS